MNTDNNLICDILRYLESYIYRVSPNGIYQRLLHYKLNNVIRINPQKLYNIALLISISDEDIILDILESIEFDKILDLLSIVTDDEYEYDPLLLEQINSMNNLSKEEFLPKLIVCEGCKEFNIQTNTKCDCKCGYIPI